MALIKSQLIKITFYKLGVATIFDSESKVHPMGLSHDLPLFDFILLVGHQPGRSERCFVMLKCGGSMSMGWLSSEHIAPGIAP